MQSVKALLAESWRVQGAVATGVWVVAHECGHGAFSRWQASATQQQAEHVPGKSHPRPLRLKLHGTLRRPSTTEWASCCTPACLCLTSAGAGFPAVLKEPVPPIVCLPFDNTSLVHFWCTECFF